MIATILIFILTLFVLILVHEFGHFVMGKIFKVKILEFGFGLPPRIFGKKWGETLVSLNALPIGGFVRLYGEDEVDKKILNDKSSFAAKSVGARIIIVIFGVIMNLLLAVFLFWLVLFAKGFQEEIPLVLPYNFIGANQVNENVILVGEVADKSPAFYAGINPGDRISFINGIKVTDINDFIIETTLKAGEAINLTITTPDDLSKEVIVVPRSNPPKGEGAIGVTLGQIAIAKISYPTITQKIFSGFIQSYNYSVYSLEIFARLVSQSFATKDLAPVSQTVSGPIGITKLAGSVLATESPLIPYLNLVALLSLNLAIINIFPFPALDGGRLLFLLIELISRRKVNEKIEKNIHLAGMVILMALIILVTFSDIKKLLP